MQTTQTERNGGEGRGWSRGGGEGERQDRGGEGVTVGMKCAAIKLSGPLTFSYKGAYLPGMAARAVALSHINAGLEMETRPYIFNSAGSEGGGEASGSELRIIDVPLLIV